MKASELADSLDTVASAAGEGALLAHGVRDGATKSTFTRARARELAESLDHEIEKLSDSDGATASITADKQQAVALTDQIDSQLAQVRAQPTDRDRARRAAMQLESLADRVDALAARQQ